MSLRIEYDERAISQAAAFLDDPPGLREALDALDRLADDPRPAGSFPYGSPDLRRLALALPLYGFAGTARHSVRTMILHVL